MKRSIPSFSRGDFGSLYSCAQIKKDSKIVPDIPGIYCVMDKKTLSLLYVGMARGVREEKQRGLRERLFKEHFYERARGSALRRHVAREVGIPVILDHSGKEAVEKIYEGEITRFIEERALFGFLPLPWGEVPAAENTARRELRPKWNPL